MPDSVTVITVGFEPTELGAIPGPALMVPCPNGQVDACKAFYVGSNPTGIFSPTA